MSPLGGKPPYSPTTLPRIHRIAQIKRLPQLPLPVKPECGLPSRIGGGEGLAWTPDRS